MPPAESVRPRRQHPPPAYGEEGDQKPRLSPPWPRSGRLRATTLIARSPRLDLRFGSLLFRHQLISVPNCIRFIGNCPVLPAPMLCMAIGNNPLNARGGGSFCPHIPSIHQLIKPFHAASSRSGLNRCSSRPQCDFNRVRNSGSLSDRAIKRANPRVSPVE